ncbi:MAG: sigma-70 family RNA polymerase sigma factor, partial [Streptosporangiaceae bacterium]
MSEHDWLAERFEENRTHLRAVAYRVLGSASEADDAVQETWLRLSRAGADGVENLGGWLTTVVARVALNMLSSRASRREEPIDSPGVSSAEVSDHADPEHEAVLADSLGLALLVVLDTLTPAERLAFVLHDMFAVPFDEIAPIVDRSPAAARQLASRARRRVQQADAAPEAETAARRDIVKAFLAASRGGDFDALLAILDPDVVLRGDSPAGDAQGALAVAGTFSGRAEAARPALIDGAPGLIWAQGGTIRVVFDFTIMNGKIVAIEMTGDHGRISELEVVPLTSAGLPPGRQGGGQADR